MYHFKKWRFVFLSLGVWSFQGHTRGDEPPTHILEIQSTTREERQKLVDMGYALDEIRSDKVFVVAREADQRKIASQGFQVKAIKIKPEWSLLGSEGPLGKKYSSYSEIQARMNALVQKSPELVSLQSYGRTHENRELVTLRISSLSPGQAESQKAPSIMYMGCHHAREHLSVEIPMLFAEYLVENYGKNPEVKRLLDSREIFVAPVVNVDGHTYDYSNGIRGKMWRKNRRNNNDGTRGVDLNRNYGYQWGTGGSSTDTDSDVYMGPSPFSEPETQAIRDFVRAQPRMTTLLSLHTFSELILYPWGHSDNPIGQERGNAADLPVFEKMAREMATWNNYKPMQSSGLYIASGDTTDWAYGELGIFAFTFELSPASIWEGGFYPDPSRRIDSTFSANLKPLLYLLEYADNPRRVLKSKSLPNFHVTPSKIGVPLADFRDLDLH